MGLLEFNLGFSYTNSFKKKYHSEWYFELAEEMFEHEKPIRDIKNELV